MRLSHYWSVFFNKYYFPTVLNKYKAKQRIRNKDFSLICGNCMGGLIYHQLDLPFRSPTVNLRILQNDFYKFIHSLKEYLNCDFVELDNKDGIPTGQLKDIIVTFTHFSSFNDAVTAWNKRRDRVNYDNLWIIATDRDGISEDDIYALKNVPCRGMVVFTAKKYDLPYCFQLKQFVQQGYVGNILKQTLFGKRYFELYFDYVAWLNSNDREVEHFRLKE